ncbi:type VII secretion protein EccB [Dietzia aerolata]|uniref:type VII secretion protein EccB n=1 Tax=Dietzia aerolata TaxID=595984 RepID=UPI00363C39C0
MPLKPTTKAQVDGHRFLTRRARHAVVSRDVRMLHDPLKRQATGLTVGVIAAVVGVAGAAVLALLDPAPDVNSTPIMMGRDSGQLYVRAGDRVHPVHNLASARLVLGEAAEPETVRDSDIAGTPRGGLLGIPGAPSALPGHRDAEAAAAVSWTVCDEVADADRGRPRLLGTSVVAREGVGPGRETGLEEVMLVEVGGAGWLLRDGTRAKIDLADTDLLTILGVDGVDPRPVSAALIDPLPELAPVARPQIDLLGEPVDYGLDGLRIGQVFTVATATGPQTFVALADGVQEVGPVLGDVIRSTSTVGEVVRVAPDRMGVPRSVALDTGAYPGPGRRWWRRPIHRSCACASPRVRTRRRGGCRLSRAPRGRAPTRRGRWRARTVRAQRWMPWECRVAAWWWSPRGGAPRRGARSPPSSPTRACGSTSPTPRPPRSSASAARRCRWTARFWTGSPPGPDWTAPPRWSPMTGRNCTRWVPRGRPGRSRAGAVPGPSVVRSVVRSVGGPTGPK